jgi:hypothetical protein
MQLICECTTLLVSSLIFSKLIIFNRYSILNLPIKLSLLYVYTASLDPLVTLSGYYYTRHLRKEEEIMAVKWLVRIYLI